MTGFGLYETLRLLIPGSIAVAVFTAVLRLSTGSGHLLSAGPYEAVIDSLQGATFLFASVAAGFILYLVDVPARARLSAEGDPGNGYVLPTAKLKEMLTGTELSSKYFSLYFILSDGKLPPELHRRVYFFGGMYRIYFDLRILAMLGVAIGGPFALVVEGHGASDVVGGEYAAYGLSILAAMVVMTLVGESKHAVESMRKDSRRGEGEYPSGKLFRRYLRRAQSAFGEMLLASVVLGGLAGVGSYLCDLDGHGFRGLGLALLVCAFSLWLMIELGPPGTVGRGNKARPSGPVRGRVLGAIRLRPASRTQYTQLQRGMVDVALLVGPLLAAARSAENLGRDATTVLLWAALALPASLVMSIRKHEQRLLAAYRDQVNWLDINEPNIRSLAEKGPNDWL